MWACKISTLISVVTCSAAATSIVTVKLEKEDVPVIVNNVTIAHKTAFFGDVYIGHPRPQKFSVVYDTGSGHLFVPSSKCNQEACVVHKQYDSRESDTAILLDFDGSVVPYGEDRDRVSITYGTGKVIGDFVNDLVCMGAPNENGDHDNSSEHCVKIRIITALEMASDPFKEFAFDGVLGLGMEALALHPDFNIFHMMSQSGSLEPVFGFFLSTTEGVKSEISFGGHAESRITEELRWAPVLEDGTGHWQVKVHGLWVGETKLDVCDGGACQAIVDTGTSLLGVPPEISQEMSILMARRVPEEMGVESPEDLNCRDFPGPPVVFDLGEMGKIEVGPAEYSQPVPVLLTNASSGFPANSTLCRSTLFPISMPFLGPYVFLFGEPVLRKYYTAYDMKNKRVGFAIAAKAPKPDDKDATVVDSDATTAQVENTDQGAPTKVTV